MRLNIVTPVGAKVEAEVSAVTAPGTAGELGILPGHRALITSLAIGKFTYLQDGRSHHLAVNEGFMEIHDDVVTVVTETAETPEEIDTGRAQLSKVMAEKELVQLDATTQRELSFQARAKLARSENRIAVAKLK
ncbi:MAG: F-type H+-transporting ATPase subunit epsilon [Myxococcota bacterium]|jgi:F-type H+-transporting ATPase subunit epsilon